MNKKKQTKNAKFKQQFFDNAYASALKHHANVNHADKTDNQYAQIINATSDQFLETPKWRELRTQVIAKYGNKCVKCDFVGTEKHPIHIDHIKPRKLYPELALSFDNLQPLCGKCNKSKGNKTDIDYREKTTM